MNDKLEEVVEVIGDFSFTVVKLGDVNWSGIEDEQLTFISILVLPVSLSFLILSIEV